MLATPFPESARRRLGRSELRVSPITLGGAFLGLLPDGSWDDELAIATVLRALDLGINLIDTSPLYGQSERRIGLALRAHYARGGRREDILLSTKTGTRVRPSCYTPEHTRDSLAQSFELLGTDYFDIVHIHDPTDMAPVLAPGNALDVLTELQAAGRIRHLGLGARPHDFHRQMIADGRSAAHITFSDLHLLRQTARDGVLAHAQAADLGIFLGSVLVYGLLGGNDPRQEIVTSRHAKNVATTPEYEVAVRLYDWCQARGISLLALNLQYCLREPGVSALLMGASTPAHIEADVAAVQAPLPASIWDDLAAAGFKL